MARSSGFGIRRDRCDSSYSLMADLLVLNEHLRRFGHRDHCDSWALVTEIIAIAGPCSQYHGGGVSNRSSWEACDLGYIGIANETIRGSPIEVHWEPVI